MTEEEKENRRKMKEYNAKMDAAFNLLTLSLKVGGVDDLIDIRRQEKAEDGKRIALVIFRGGKKRANITADSIPAAIFDILKQVPELHY